MCCDDVTRAVECFSAGRRPLRVKLPKDRLNLVPTGSSGILWMYPR
jgi:hypothetical protein